MRRLLRWIQCQWTLILEREAYEIAKLYGGPEVVDLLYKKPEEKDG